MRIILNNIGVITVYLILMFIRCSDCSDDNWEFMGKDNVGVSTIIYDDTISVNDSLYIEIRGNTIIQYLTTPTIPTLNPHNNQQKKASDAFLFCGE